MRARWMRGFLFQGEKGMRSVVQWREYGVVPHLLVGAGPLGPTVKRYRRRRWAQGPQIICNSSVLKSYRLLYTPYASDEEERVEFGCRRIMKKKTSFLMT